ncbi:hypothetical protein LCGC14_1252150, partial [marine sediment metagenome]
TGEYLEGNDQANSSELPQSMGYYPPKGERGRE